MDWKNVYDIKLTNNKGKKWLSTTDFAIKGFAFCKEKLLEGNILAETIIESIKNNKLASLLVELNGNFSVILYFNERIYLIADKIRSYPIIFTKNRKNQWFVTDSAIGIEENKNIEKHIDSLISAEFLALGYISGNDTLYKGIYTVDAGEYVILEVNGTYSRKSYFKYIFEKKIFNRDKVIKDAYNSIEAAFRRMIDTIPEDSQIAIPLSGGYDSRLIACLCKKYHLPNVICYTYGRQESFEVSTSRKVAEILGFEWYYVEYSSEKLADCILSDEFRKFSKFTSNCNSIPHIQDFLALQDLQRKDIIKEGAIIIPGFCGDVFGGSKIPREIFNWSNKKLTVREFANLVYSHFFDLNQLTKKTKDKIVHRIEKKIQDTDISEKDKFLNQYEQWCITNRLSKYIINSNRVYEFFGFDWRMPLWDDEYAKTWYQVPWEDKTADLLEEFMFNNYFNKFHVDSRKIKIFSSKNVILNSLRHYLPKKIKARLIKIFSLIVNKKKRDYNCFEGAALILSDKYPLNFSEIEKPKIHNILAIISRLKLQEYIKMSDK